MVSGEDFPLNQSIETKCWCQHQNCCDSTCQRLCRPMSPPRGTPGVSAGADRVFPDLGLGNLLHISHISADIQVSVSGRRGSSHVLTKICMFWRILTFAQWKPSSIFKFKDALPRGTPNNQGQTFFRWFTINTIRVWPLGLWGEDPVNSHDTLVARYKSFALNAQLF